MGHRLEMLHLSQQTAKEEKFVSIIVISLKKGICSDFLLNWFYLNPYS